MGRVLRARPVAIFANAWLFFPLTIALSTCVVGLPLAARVLRSGARLVFMTNHAFAIVCAPDDEESPLSETLQRPYLGLFRTEWADSAGEVEFHLPHGRWIDLLRTSGFEVERLVEMGARPDAESRYAWADARWAGSWPTEEVWCVRRR